jgi:hypothetical protein
MPQDAVDYLVEHIPEFTELPERQRLILFAVHAGGEGTHPDLVNFVPGHSRDLNNKRLDKSNEFCIVARKKKPPEKYFISRGYRSQQADLNR